MSPTPNFHLNIDYQDNSVEDRSLNVYEAVMLTIPGGEVIRFETNDPVEDYKAATRLVTLLQKLNPTAAVFLSSDVNHFTNDVVGYRWNDEDLIEVDPNDPPIVIVDSELIDFQSLPYNDRIAVALTTSSLNAARQAAFKHARDFPELRRVFLAIDAAYREHSARFGLPTEMIFDEVAYRRERAAVGDVLCAQPLGRKGFKA